MSSSSSITSASSDNKNITETKLINLLQNVIPFYDVYNREFILDNLPINLYNEVLSTKYLTDIESSTYVYDVKKYTQQTLLETRLRNCLHILKEFPIISRNSCVQIKASESKSIIEIKNDEPIRIGQLLDILPFYGDSQMNITKLTIDKKIEVNSTTYIINVTIGNN